MCGILGAVNFAGKPLAAEDRQVEYALDMMAHRGPDDRGLWWNHNRSAVLGHRRLSIIDLSAAGHQPMPNADQSLWITYNGEVYNFADIRRDLQAMGHQFRSGTDTEVIVTGYQVYGPDIVNKLRGMFAFAIYDTRDGSLFLARDRVGIKPLYYTWTGDTLVFASELKSVISMPGVSRGLDKDALNQYLIFGKTYAPRTMFSGVWKLPAGHYARVRQPGELNPVQFWTPYQNRLEFPEGADEGYFAGRLLDLLQESVRLRMMSDVPVGVFLSGGVDSTANVALMSRLTNSPVRTYTAGFRNQAEYDEREVARTASKLYGTDHSEVEIGPKDMQDLLPELSYFLDEPVSDPTVVPIHFVSKLARQSGAIVILNGDGSDELFCGYRKYMKYLKLKPYWDIVNRIPKPLRRSLAGIGGVFGGDGVVKDLLERSVRGVEFYSGGVSPLKQMASFRSVIDNGGHSSAYAPVLDGHRQFAGMHRSSDYAEWLSYWGLRSEVEEIFLYRADRIGMANSIEIRVPFLDHRMVEFAMQMPQELKYRGGQPKYLLKKALEGIIPNELIYRKKQGFCVPMRQWAGQAMNDKIAEVLPRIHSQTGAMSRQVADDICNYVRGNAAADANGDLIWSMYSLATWYERWMN